MADREKIFKSLPVLETERLIMRAVEESDCEGVFGYAGDPEVAKYTTWEAHKTAEDSRTLIRFIRKRYEGNKPSNWAVITKQEKKLIGMCGFVSMFGPNKRAEISFAFRKDCWNMGFATEAVKKTLEFGFKTLDLNRIEAVCDSENKASSRVLEKCGMKFEGILRHYALVRGAFRDMRSYSALREEYFKTAK